MSQDNQTHIPASQASRRAVLMVLAAAATPMAPALANALSEARAVDVDPIFDLIERHAAACDAAQVLCSHDTHPSDPNYDAIRARFQEAYKTEHEALVALLTCQPTTLAGTIAVLEHVGQPDWVFGDDSEDTVLTDAHAREMEEAKPFPKHLAAALRNTIAVDEAGSPR
jgi:hypothetical protein